MRGRFNTTQQENSSGLTLRRAFTLVESILALAIFAMASAAISQVCYNCIYPLSIADEKPDSAATMDLCLAAIQDVSDYDALDDGIDVTGLDGTRFRVYGYAEPTQIPDLFELEMVARGESKEIKTKVLVIRKGWYEDTNLRDDLVEDRTDFLEEKRKADVRR